MIRVKQIESAELKTFISDTLSEGAFSGALYDHYTNSGFLGNTIVYATGGDQIIDGQKTFNISPNIPYIVESGQAVSKQYVDDSLFFGTGDLYAKINQDLNLTGLVSKSYVDTLVIADSIVRNTGNQTIFGRKNFINPVTVPNPISGYDAVTKAYVDNKLNAACLTVFRASGITGLNVSGINALVELERVVRTTGWQEINGQKIFTTPPSVPVGLYSHQAVRKSQLDALGVSMGGVSGFAGVLTFNGTSGASGHVYLDGAGTVSVTQCGSLFTISGFTDISGLIVDYLFSSAPLNIGTTTQNIEFPNLFNSIPKVLTTLEVPNIPFPKAISILPSNITTSGFTANFSAPLSETGYNLSYYATTGNGMYSNMATLEHNIIQKITASFNNFSGQWQPDYKYIQGSIVYNSGLSYICYKNISSGVVSGFLSGVIPGVEASGYTSSGFSWYPLALMGDKGDPGKSMIEAWSGEWIQNAAYNPGTVVYNLGSSYVCINSTSINEAPETGRNWKLLAKKGEVGRDGKTIAENWKGAFSTGYNYAYGDVVTAQGSTYLCLGDPQYNYKTEAALTGGWAIIAKKGESGANGIVGRDGESMKDVWSGQWYLSEFYRRGSVVYSSGSSYVCINDYSTGHAPGDENFWELVASKGEVGSKGDDGESMAQAWSGAWSIDSAYKKGSVVSVNGSTYVSTSYVSGGNDPSMLENWNLVAKKGDAGNNGLNGESMAQAWKGDWSNYSNYNFGNVVYFDGCSYVCTALNSIGVEPSTSGTDWGIAVLRGGIGPSGRDGLGMSQAWKGEWNDSVNYTFGDVIYRLGSSYVCSSDSIGEAPENGINWSPLAIKGDIGSQGLSGTAGSNGSDGMGMAQAWSGQWEEIKTYDKGSIVSYSGSSYVSITVTSGNTPDNASFWNLVAQAGVIGSEGNIVNAWNGQWVSGQTYNAGSIVSNNGSAYICDASTIDEEPGFFGPWAIFSSKGEHGNVIQSWRGVWQNNIEYTAGDIVENNGSSYIASILESGNEPGASGSWEMLAAKGTDGESMAQAWKGNWSDATTYNKGNVVSFTGNSFVCIETTSLNSTPGVYTDWEIVAAKGQNGESMAQAWKGGWDEFITYNHGNVVYRNGSSYVCEETTSLGNAPELLQDWAELSIKGDTGSIIQAWFGLWDSETYYVGGSIVRYNDSSYIAVSDTITDAPGTVPAWQLFASRGIDGQGMAQAWKGYWGEAIEYVRGDIVHYVGSSYVCVQTTSLNEDPISYGGVWEYVSERGNNGSVNDSYDGAWSDSVPYAPGRIVTNNGSTYISNDNINIGEEPGFAGAWSLFVAKGEQGNLVTNWMGSWNNETEYARGSIVYIDGSSYIAHATASGDQPGISGPWDNFVMRGNNGSSMAEAWSGEWNPTGLYNYGSVVYNSGSSYVCVNDLSINTPPEDDGNAHWSLVSKAGHMVTDWRGAWISGEFYNIGDTVEYNGSTYLTKYINIGSIPGIDPEWELVVSKGFDGVGMGEAWSGQWNSESNYNRGTIIHNSGSTYVSIVNCSGTGQIPGAEASWELVSAKGLDGETMAQAWKGDWNDYTTFIKGNVVSFLGSSYVCVETGSLNSTPGVYPDWELVAQKGDLGQIINSWSGQWLVDADYTVGTVVHNGGSAYISYNAVMGEEPGVVGSWQLFAAKGDKGDIGISSIDLNFAFLGDQFVTGENFQEKFISKDMIATGFAMGLINAGTNNTVGNFYVKDTGNNKSVITSFTVNAGDIFTYDWGYGFALPALSRVGVDLFEVGTGALGLTVGLFGYNT